MRQDVRSLALFDNQVWIFPALETEEKLQLTWTGVRTTWTDSTVMPATRPWVDQYGTFSREVEEFIELGLQWRIAMHDDKDPQLAANFKGLYDRKLAELISLGVQSKRVDYLTMGAVECGPRGCL